MKHSIFSNMNWLDWVLAISITGLLGALGYLLFLKISGVVIGALAGLLMLYLAKRSRDAAYTADAKEDQSDPSSKEDKPSGEDR